MLPALERAVVKIIGNVKAQTGDVSEQPSSRRARGGSSSPAEVRAGDGCVLHVGTASVHHSGGNLGVVRLSALEERRLLEEGHAEDPGENADVDHFCVVAVDDAAVVGESAGGGRQVDVEQDVVCLLAQGVVDEVAARGGNEESRGRVDDKGVSGGAGLRGSAGVQLAANSASRAEKAVTL